MFELRPYQQEAIDASVAYLTNPAMKGRHGIVVAPTGSGKSLVIANIVQRLPGQCVVLQPTKEILQQNVAKMESYGYRPAVYSASMGRREIGKITFATIGTLIKRADDFAHLPFVLIDEAHALNAGEGMYREFVAATPQARWLGLTATPYRLASNSFGAELRFLTRTSPRVFRDVVHVAQPSELHRDGWLAPIAYHQIKAVDRARLKLNPKGTDYTDESVQAEFRATGFVKQLVDAVLWQLSLGRRNVLVFTRSIDESDRLAKAIPGTAVVTSDTPPRDRDRIVRDLKAGLIRVATNVGIFGLGFDFPALECVVLGRPSVSLAVYYQQVGRAVRPHPGKPAAHVVDLVGLVDMFGKVEDLNVRQQPSPKGVPLWCVCSGDRPLTNVYFAQRDAVDPAQAAKGAKRRQFWARKKGGGRWRGGR